MDPEIAIRPATAADIPELLRQRRAMFEDMGTRGEETLAAMVAAARPYLEAAIGDGTFHGWLAESGAGEILGGGAVVVRARPPSPNDPQPLRAEILNVYTYPSHRRRGVARRLVETMIEWCRARGMASVSLHASADGRPLYERLGFEPTNEMRLELRPRPS